MSLEDRLARLIAAEGPISVERYMAEANAHYYATRDPLGAAGDFVTAPEISQMFGELVGLWLADVWDRAGRPPARYVELGPGRGTLAEDALRAMRAAAFEPSVELVETSPALRGVQAERLPGARWHDDLSTLPDGGAVLVVANEFFDALPIRQQVMTAEGWRDRHVGYGDGGFFPAEGPPAEAGADAAVGTVLEFSPAAVTIVRELAQRLAGQGGAALIVDYGHGAGATGDTLQAMSRHAYADPWADPGERDLTAHVDFAALAEAARREGVRAFGPVSQGEWLRAMGIEIRAAALAKAAPARASEVGAARDRLTSTDAMGGLFKVMALVSPDWPVPEGL